MKTNNEKVLTAQMAKTMAQEVKSSLRSEVKTYIMDYVERRISLAAGAGKMSVSISLEEIRDIWRNHGLPFTSANPNVLFTLAELDLFIKEACTKQTEYGFVYDETSFDTSVVYEKEGLSSEHRTFIHKLSWE